MYSRSAILPKCFTGMIRGVQDPAREIQVWRSFVMMNMSCIPMVLSFTIELHDLAIERDVLIAPDARRSRRPLAHAIHRYNGRLFKWRNEKRARRVRHMMIIKNYFALVLKFLANDRADEKLPLDPMRNRLGERLHPSGEIMQKGKHQAFEFDERLIVKSDVIEILHLAAGLAQAVLDGVFGEIRVVLYAREALLACGSDEAAVANETRSGIVKKSGNPKNKHKGEVVNP